MSKSKIRSALLVAIFLAGFFAVRSWSARHRADLNPTVAGVSETAQAATATKLKNLIYYPAGVNANYKYKGLDDNLMGKVKNSPFDSFVIQLSQKNESDFPKYDDLSSGMNAVKKSGKFVWPRVYFNMLLGCCEPPACVQKLKTDGQCNDRDKLLKCYEENSPDTGYKCNSGGWYCSNACVPANSLGTYFKDIKEKGKYIDLWDRAGARAKFYNLVETAAKTAKNTGSPGIFLDHEFYNNYSLGKVAPIDKVNSETAQQIIGKLREIGGTIADRVNKAYNPNAGDKNEAVILFASANLNSNNYETVNYVIEGILDRASKKTDPLPLKVVDGGESTVRYLHSSWDDKSAEEIVNKEHRPFALKQRMDKQKGDLQAFLNKYPKNFALGGTQGLYLDWKQTTGEYLDQLNDMNGKGWLKATGGSYISSPLLTNLFQNREYVWVFGSASSGPGNYQYNDFSDNGNPGYFKQYRDILQAALKGNGVCEPTRNETCENSPEDCKPCPLKPLTGDLNGDGAVNQADFDILKADFLKTAPANPKSDIDGDGMVTVKDAGILMSEWK